MPAMINPEEVREVTAVTSDKVLMTINIVFEEEGLSKRMKDALLILIHKQGKPKGLLSSSQT